MDATSRHDAAVVPRFDAEIHAPVRLRICGMLAVAKSIDFATMRDALGVADSVLSKHLSRLEAAGYVTISKSSRRTWVRCTETGRAAFEGHAAALRQIVDG